MRFEFTITPESKAKAKKRRIKGERKWVLLRLLSIVSLVISLVSGTIGIFLVPHEQIALVDILGALFSVCLITFFVLHLSYGWGSLVGILKLPFSKR